jgi:hypothetical protein
MEVKVVLRRKSEFLCMFERTCHLDALLSCALSLLSSIRALECCVLYSPTQLTALSHSPSSMSDEDDGSIPGPASRYANLWLEEVEEMDEDDTEGAEAEDEAEDGIGDDDEDEEVDGMIGDADGYEGEGEGESSS